MSHTLLFVDDEPNILKVLTRLLRRLGHEILTAPGGAEALEILKNREVSLIISDQRMPGMSGAELLTEARELQPEAVRIMLTGYSDLQAAMQAINEGGVHRFLSKPWDDDALRNTVQEALADLDLRREHAALQEQVKRQNAELKDLNENLEGKVRKRTEELQRILETTKELNQRLKQQNLSVVKAFAGLLDLRSPHLGAHCRRVASWVEPVCRRLGLNAGKELQDITIAALLHDVGKIALPDSLVIKDYSHLGANERVEMKKHTVLGQGQVQVVDGLAELAQIIRSHHENVDGSGYPDGLVEEDIPFGARVIRVLNTYDNLTHGGARKGGGEKMCLEAMDRQVGRYFDGQIFNALLGVLDKREDEYDTSREVKTPVKDLAVDMTLSRDLKTQNGMLLMQRDETLKESHIEKISNYSAIYSIEPYAYVYRSRKSRASAPLAQGL